MLRRVTLHQLRLFVRLARHMNMTRAAEEVHVTPSAFSIQIKQLSEASACRCMSRSARSSF